MHALHAWRIRPCKDRKHREKKDESQKNGARLNIDKTKNAEDWKKKGQRFDKNI